MSRTGIIFAAVLAIFALPCVAAATAAAFDENFDAYGSPANPPGWYDTNPGRPDEEALGLFKTWSDPLDPANTTFGHKGASHALTHWRTEVFSSGTPLHYEGRMLRRRETANMGVTFFSTYPSPDQYYLLGVDEASGTVQLSATGLGPLVGDVDSGVAMEVDVWYRFALRTEPLVDGGLRIVAKIWPEDEPEPEGWLIDAVDESASLIEGWIGVWGEGAGHKYWDDLLVIRNTTAPVISILEGGQPLLDGSLYNRPVTPVIVVTHEAPYTLTATLNGESFTSGTTIDIDGSYELTAQAVDEFGNTATATVHFTIDTTPPVFLSIQPPDGTLTATSQATLMGQVDDAAGVTADGAPAALAGQDFSYGPITLSEGDNVFLLRAVDEAGNAAEQTHTLVLDTTAPVVTISQPPAGVTGTATTTVSGTAVDLHLTEVRVNGSVATFSGSGYQLDGVTLTEGVNTITVDAVDAVGNTGSAQRTVTLDTIAPVITVSGISDGQRTNQPVTPVVTIADATQVSSEILLNGAPFVSGSTVSGEGSHTLSVTATDQAGNFSSFSLSFEIDLTSPVFVSVSPADGSVIGTAEVTLTGQVTGAVSVTVDGTPATLTGDTFTAGPFTVTGQRVFTLVAVDDVGNETVLTHTLIVDTEPPALTITEPADGAVLGIASTVVSGAVSDAHLAEVRVNGQLATVSGGTYTLASLALAEGSNTITVEATDTVGNTATAQVTVAVDAVPPTIQVNESNVPLADGSLFARAVTPLIEVDDATEVSVQALLNGLPYISGTPVATDGAYTLTVTATDAAGNSAAFQVTFTIDTTPPRFVSVEPAAGTVFGNDQATLIGQVQGASEVTVDGAAVALTGESFTAGPYPLTEGGNSWLLVAIDTAGNRAELTHTIVYDGTPPVLSIAAPEDGALLGNASVDVAGEAFDDHLTTVTVNGIAATLTGPSFLATQVPLAEGANVLTATATDAAANSAEASVAVVLDTQPPTIAITDPAAGTTTAAATVTVTGTVADPHLDRVAVNGTPATLSGGAWSVTLPLAEGGNEFVAEAFDLLGHSAQDAVTVVRDSTAPEIAITVPEEGSYFNTPTIAVSGTVSDEPGLTVTVNGLPATATGGVFEATEVLLVEGENRLLARAIDALGNTGTHTRTVYLDTVPPSLVASQPAGGALAIGADSVFLLTFSEALAPPAEGSWTLSTAGGEVLPATLEFSGTGSVVRPAAPLPSGIAVELALTEAITDPAGNPLAAQTLVFTVADQNAPDPPSVSPVPPAYLCTSAVALTGTAEPGGTVRATGGAAVAETTVDGSGDFSVTVQLVTNRLNTIELTVHDAVGNVSTPTTVSVVHDCVAPFVSAAHRTGEQFTAVFSEPIDPATALAAGVVGLSAATGPITGSVSVTADGRQATFTPDLPLGDETLRFAVTQQVADLAANPLAFPFSRVFGGTPEESFITGTVLDNASGRPLAGALVSVVTTDGLTLPEPLPEAVSGVDGRFSIPVAAGTHEVTIVRIGYSPVFRIVSTQPNLGTDLFDPRLTPSAESRTIGSGGGQYVGDTGVSLSLPAGALATEAEVTVTALEEQGLTALLPYGWSPRGAVWVDFGAGVLNGAATLTLPVEAGDGTLLAVAELDLATLQWRVVRELTVENGTVTTAIESAGAFAAVEPDSGSLAPPPPVVGSVLGSSPPPDELAVVGATLDFNPAIVLPSQRSWVTTAYDVSGEVPSGLPLTLVVQEELQLLDGSTRAEAPYQADLVLYRSPSGAVRSQWGLQPSQAARLLPLELGHEDVTLNRYAGETVRGNVLGPAGGSVTNDQGDRLDLPAGAFAEPTAVILRRGEPADLPLALPAEGQVDGVVIVEAGGQVWDIPAAISLALDLAPAAGEYGLLLQVIELPSGPAYRAVAVLTATATGWSTAVIDPADLAWPGVLSGGTFVFLRHTQDVAYLRGTVFDVLGAPLPAATVAAGSSWLQISGADGSYVLPVLLGPATVHADNPLTGNAVSVAANAAIAQERIHLNLSLVIVPPQVVEITPADGAVDVPSGVNPTARFSEPVDPTSLDAGIELLESGSAVDVTFDVQGSLVTMVPATALLPGATFELRVGSAVRDLAGYQLATPVSSTFTTQRILFSDDIDLTKVRLIEPDVNGLAAVIGEAGAVPNETLVFVENLTSLASTTSVQAGQDGSFNLAIEASVADRLLLHVLIEGGNEIVLELTPFRTADGKGAWIGSDAIVFATADGLIVSVEENTFDGPTKVTVAPETLGGNVPAVPEGLASLYQFTLEIDGSPAKRGLRISVPAPAGSRDGLFLVTRPVNSFWGRKWMLDDIGRLADGKLSSELSGEELAQLRERRGEPPLPEETSPLYGGSGESLQVVGGGMTTSPLSVSRLQSSTLAGTADQPVAAGPRLTAFAAASPAPMAPESGTDSDGDGMPDDWETANGLDPNVHDADLDPDADGLTNLAEYNAQTDPQNPDTDGDGLTDGDEVSVHGTDPAHPDTDADTLTDGAEINQHGTDPLLADTDGDGASDGAEVAQGTDPLNPDDVPAAVPYPANFPRWELPGMHSPYGKRSYQFLQPEIGIGFISLPFYDNAVYYNSALQMVAAMDAAVSRILINQSPSIMMITRLNDPFGIELRDLSTGFKLFDETFDPPPGVGELIELPVNTEAADTTPPRPVGGTPLRFIPVEAGPRQSPLAAPGIEVSFNPGADPEAAGTLTIIGSVDSVQREVQVRLVGLDNDIDTFTTSDSEGAFSLTASTPAGTRFVLAVGARVSANQPLLLEFSEALNEELTGIDVAEGELSVAPLVEAVGTRATVRISPRSGWRAGATYTLRLTPELTDASANAWGENVAIDFTVEESQVLSTYDLGEARDVARAGSLLFVAGGFQGLVVLDASDPANIRNYLPGGATLTGLAGDSVRGVAVDPHYRVLFTLGGGLSAGRLRIVDPLLIDPDAIAAAPGDTGVLLASVVGQTLVTNWPNGSFTQLPEGTPRRIAILSNDVRDEWVLGDPPPGVTITPAEPPPGATEYEITVSGSGASGGNLEKDGNGDYVTTTGLPVTLTDLDTGRWNRVNADKQGNFTVTLTVRPGDRLELLKNQDTIAYLAVSNAGVAAVDVNAFYHEIDSNPTKVDVVGYYTGQGASICPDEGPELFSSLVNIGLLHDPANPVELAIPSLIYGRGVEMVQSWPGTPGTMQHLGAQCVQSREGRRNVVGLDVLQHYPLDLNGDGVFQEREYRDYLVVGIGAGEVVIYDATSRAYLVEVSRIRMPGSVNHVAVDRVQRRIYAAGYGGGLYIIDLGGQVSRTTVDANQDGLDDRIVETIELTGDTRSPILVDAERGLVYVGGAERGLTAINVHRPQLTALAADPAGGMRQIDRLAPFGVPEDPGRAGSFRILASLPGYSGSTVTVDLESLGPGGLGIDGAGASAAVIGLPKAAYTGTEAIVLRRQSDTPTDPGYARFLSDEIAVLADLRAAQEYVRNSGEQQDDVCKRCDPAAEGVADGAIELLSGHTVRARLTDTTIAQLAAVYGELRLDSLELVLESVPWALSPAVLQEPARNRSSSSGSAAPGTLLHSGEQSHAAVDLTVRSRGFDFTFARTYRNQTVGSGPFGPGWNHVYNQKLRPLPNGDVEYFDGRGRRELFQQTEGGGFNSPPGRFADLRRVADGYLLIDARRTLYSFDRWGRMASLADATKEGEGLGNEMTFHYDLASRLVRITDTLGRDFFLEYNAEGRIERLTDFSGREVLYGYDGEGRLTTVSSPEVTSGGVSGRLVTTYGYATAGGDLTSHLNRRDNLETFTDARGETWLVATYTDADGDGRSDEVTSQSWGGHPLSIAYNFGARTATVTDRRRNDWQFTHNGEGQATSIVEPGGYTTTTEYNSDGLPTRQTLPEGRLTEWVYDVLNENPRARGNALETRVTADSRGANGSAALLVTTAEYDPVTNQPTRVTDPRGNVTAIARDTRGLATSVTRGEGSPAASTTRTEYNEYGQVEKLTDPRGYFTRYDYYVAGERKGYLESAVVDAADAARPADGTDPLALTTRYEPDARGNVVAVTDPRGVRHTTEYNEVDWPVAGTQAVSGATDGSPEAGPLGYRTEYGYDEVGQVLSTRVPYGETGAAATRVETDYGVLGEVTEVRRQVEPGGAFLTTARTYDENFNLETETAPEGNIRTQTYNARNLLATVTLGGVQESYSYDGDGARTTYTNGRTHVWTTEYDGYGRVSKAIDPLGQNTTTAYDDSSNPVLAKSFDASGTLLSQTGGEYDALDRRTASARLELETGTELRSSTGYDAAGNVTSQTDALNRTASSRYDGAGRLVESIDPAGNRLAQTLDAGGNAVLRERIEVLPEGGTVTIPVTGTFDALGRPLSATDALGNTTRTAYDARGNALRRVDAEGNLTTFGYDGLDRLTRTVRPEGISVDYQYDGNSRLRFYTDALGNTTEWLYDARNRKERTIYPDGTEEGYGYDGADNVETITDANGSTVTQGFDASNRLTSRTVTLGAGVEGVTAETYGYDGLNRLTSAASGGVATGYGWDSLSRMRTETVAGRTVTYTPDAVGNVRDLAYPSGHTLTTTYDPLNRPSNVGGQVSYGYRGYQVGTKTLANGITGTMGFDAVDRVTARTFAVPDSPAGSQPALAETISWNPRGLKAAMERQELGGRGHLVGYDGAGRVTETAGVLASTVTQANNAPTPAGFASGLPDANLFQYDAAENLYSHSATDEGISEALSLPPSNRNRPASINGIALTYDANGNLTQKGDRRFHYDYRNRLARVTDVTSGAEVAAYTYDAFNRRVAKTVNGETTEIAWSGWRNLEEYVPDGVGGTQISSRRTFGGGLDEVVRQETDLDGDGTLELASLPIYDSSGNLAAMTDGTGKVVERYLYEPYGGRTIYADVTPPVVEQIRTESGALVLELSEPVREEPLSDPGLVLTVDGTGEEIALTASQPVTEGRFAGQRVMLTPASAPGTGEAVTLTVPAAALKDSFDNAAGADTVVPFTWPTADAVIEDASAPQLARIAYKEGKLELLWDESIAPASAGTAITLNGQPTSWSAAADGYTLHGVDSIPNGRHTLAIGTGPLDLAGNGVLSAYALEFEKVSSATACNGDVVCIFTDERVLLDTLKPGQVAASTLGNAYGFHGRPVDPETGLIYMRNRYYDPELGRFLTADPLGYVDGPSMYGFAGNDPLNKTDPLGLYQEDFHYYVVHYMASIALRSDEIATRVAFASQYTDDQSVTMPVHGLSGFNFLDSENYIRLRDYHFPNYHGDPVERSSPMAQYLVNQAIASGDEYRLGIALHTLADSFSHEGFSSVWSEDNDRGHNILPEYGHGEDFGVDLPFNDTAKAAEAGLAVYDAIWQFGQRQGIAKARLTPLQEDNLRGELGRLFASFKSTKSGRIRRWQNFLSNPQTARFGGRVFVPTYTKDGGMIGLNHDFEARFLAAAAAQRQAVGDWGKTLGPSLRAPSRRSRLPWSGN